MTDRDVNDIEQSRLCGWLAYRPGQSKRVELWEKWWPSGVTYRVHLQHCSKAILVSRDFACGEVSARSRQLAASVMERRLDVSAARLAYEHFACDYIYPLRVEPGRASWIITKEDLVLWWAMKRDLAEGINDVEVISTGPHSTFSRGAFTGGRMR